MFNQFCDNTVKPVRRLIRGKECNEFEFTVDVVSQDGHWKVLLKDKSGVVKCTLLFAAQEVKHTYNENYIKLTVSGGEYWGERYDYFRVFKLKPKSADKVLMLYGLLMIPVGKFARKGLKASAIAQELKEANRKLSLVDPQVKFTFDDLKDKMYRACKKLIETCGKQDNRSRSESLARDYVKKLGVVYVITNFHEEFQFLNKEFTPQKSVLKVYKECQTRQAQKGLVINAGSRPTKIKYLAQVLKSFLMDENFPIV
mmetsp:Transcript_14980/g.28625  ORF Transcript_14980/g.28625 Transcript_14980/m.28625 type:complete len:256 (+) Transcript_14980:75-842(+)